MALGSVLSVLVVLALSGANAQKEACLSGAKYAYDLEDCHRFYICVGPVGYRMSCPGNLVFSLEDERCIYGDSLKIDRCQLNANGPKNDDGGNSIDESVEIDTTQAVKTTPIPGPKGIAMESRCLSGASLVPHEGLCHRYFNCTNPHMGDNSYLTPYEYECPYPQLFSTLTMECEHFEVVQCNNRREVVDPCEYSAKMCSGPNCKICRDEHASCVGQPDGVMYWPGREGTGYWVECRKQRTVTQGDCGEDEAGSMKIFSNTKGKCVKYNEIVEEICQWTGTQLPHATECHKYYDCSNRDAEVSPGTSFDYESTCPYPQLFSVATGKCEDFDKVNCGARREAKTPCDYMTAACSDVSYGSCLGLPDGPNVYKTREGSPHYVTCRDERTVSKLMCPMDGRGLYMQFAPGQARCMPVNIGA